jgi:hypothetical protein
MCLFAKIIACVNSALAHKPKPRMQKLKRIQLEKKKKKKNLQRSISLWKMTGNFANATAFKKITCENSTF